MPAIVNNTSDSRYEQKLDGGTVFADYQRAGNTLSITHVETPLALRGKGAAGAFMAELMPLIRQEGITKIRPLCGYAAAWLQRHSEYADLL